MFVNHYMCVPDIAQEHVAKYSRFNWRWKTNPYTAPAGMGHLQPRNYQQLYLRLELSWSVPDQYQIIRLSNLTIFSRSGKFTSIITNSFQSNWSQRACISYTNTPRWSDASKRLINSIPKRATRQWKAMSFNSFARRLEIISIVVLHFSRDSFGVTKSLTQ